MPDQSTDTQAAGRKGRGKAVGLPGLWAASGAALVSAVFVFTWALPQLAQPAPDTTGLASLTLSEVPADELAEASRLLSGYSALQARLRQEDRKCGAHLAMLTAVGMPGSSGKQASVRFESGGWFSPLFKLSTKPARIALPFPAPYGIGRGTIKVIRAGGEAMLSLTPAWRLSGSEGTSFHDVHWVPDRNCPVAEGGTP